jgi:hypothetical protein
LRTLAGPLDRLRLRSFDRNEDSDGTDGLITGTWLMVGEGWLVRTPPDDSSSSVYLREGKPGGC